MIASCSMPFLPPSPAQKELRTGELPGFSTSLYRRLRTTMKRNSLSTKLRSHCGDGGDKARQTQADTLNYNRATEWRGGPLRRAKKDGSFKALLVLAIAVTVLIANESPVASGQDIEWTGTTSTTWGTGTNWNPTGVPTGTDNAVFNGTFTNPPTLTASEPVGRLWLTDPVGQDVTVGGAHLLLLEGNTINGNANLGVLVDNSSAFTLTIACDIRIVNSQGWANNSSNLLTVSGGVDLNGQTLTVSGSGNTLMSESEEH